MSLLFWLSLAHAADFATCARFLNAFADGQVLRRASVVVPKPLRRRFAGTDKLIHLGQAYYVTLGDFTRAGRVRPEYVRVAEVEDDVWTQLSEWGLPYDLVARRQASPRADQAGRLGVGDVVKRLGVHFVLHRPVHVGRAAWQFEAYRFNACPSVGARANGLATLVGGEYEWVGRALIGRHANVLLFDPGDGERTHLVPLPPPPADERVRLNRYVTW